MFDDFRIPCDQPHSRVFGGLLHGRCHTTEQRYRQTLLQNKPNTEIERLCAAHREIVDGAIDRKCADVAAGKEQWVDDIAIGRERQPGIPEVEHGAIVREIGGRCGESGAKHLLNELVHQ